MVDLSLKQLREEDLLRHFYGHRALFLSCLPKVAQVLGRQHHVLNGSVWHASLFKADLLAGLSLAIGLVLVALATGVVTK